MTDDNDTMVDRIEEKIRDLVLAADDELAVMYRGDPFLVPVPYHPFAFVLVTVEGEDDSRGQETGPATYWRYEGFIEVDSIIKDALTLVPDSRKADIGSYTQARRIIQRAKRSVYAWGGPAGTIADADQVVDETGKERTIELGVSEVQNGLQERGDNVTNTALFRFVVKTRRQEW